MMDYFHCSCSCSVLQLELLSLRISDCSACGNLPPEYILRMLAVHISVAKLGHNGGTDGSPPLPPFHVFQSYVHRTRPEKKIGV